MKILLTKTFFFLHTTSCKTDQSIDFCQLKSRKYQFDRFDNITSIYFIQYDFD
jgi:hypothetical protein